MSEQIYKDIINLFLANSGCLSVEDDYLYVGGGICFCINKEEKGFDELKKIMDDNITIENKRGGK